MTDKQLAIAAGAIVVAGLGITAYTARRRPARPQAMYRAIQPGDACARTRHVYAESENKYERIKAKQEGEFFRCPWTTPQGLVHIEVERGNPQAIRWLQRQMATS
jgi:hypothetical protein